MAKRTAIATDPSKLLMLPRFVEALQNLLEEYQHSNALFAGKAAMEATFLLEEYEVRYGKDAKRDSNRRAD